MYKLALKRKRYVRRFCFLFLGTVFKVVIYTPINLISQDLLNLPRCLLQGILLKFANEKKTLLKQSRLQRKKIFLHLHYCQSLHLYSGLCFGKSYVKYAQKMQKYTIKTIMENGFIKDFFRKSTKKYVPGNSPIYQNVNSSTTTKRNVFPVHWSESCLKKKKNHHSQI